MLCKLKYCILKINYIFFLFEQIVFWKMNSNEDVECRCRFSGSGWFLKKKKSRDKLYPVNISADATTLVTWIRCCYHSLINFEYLKVCLKKKKKISIFAFYLIFYLIISPLKLKCSEKKKAKSDAI